MSAPPPPLECPASLRRRAPEAIIILDSKRRPPRVSSNGTLLVARHRYEVRIILPPGETNDSVQVSLTPDEHFRLPGEAQKLSRADGKKEFVLSFRTSRLFRPWPVRTHISIVLNHPRWGAYGQELPAIIWPSLLNRVLWSLSVVAAPLLVPFLSQICLYEGHLRSVPEILDKLRDSSEMLWITLAGTAGIGVLVYLVSWGYQLIVAAEGA